MADVKRYGEVRYFLPHEGWRYGIGELPKGDYVDYEDYASLRASHCELLELVKFVSDDKYRCVGTVRSRIDAAIAKGEGV